MPNSNNPTSLRRQESSRANGAKSRGPVTPEGKARSSRNASLANCITITEQDEADFEELRDQYEIDFAPRNAAQADIVTQIAWNTFRLHLAWAEETSLLGLRMELDKEEVDEDWTNPTEHTHRALAVVACLKESNALSLVQRYIRSLSTQIERSIKLLLLMQKQPLPAPPGPEVPAAPEPQPQKCKIEPIPINEHRESPRAELQNGKNEPSPRNEHRLHPSSPPLWRIPQAA